MWLIHNLILVIYVSSFDVSHMRMTDGLNKAITYLLTYLLIQGHKAVGTCYEGIGKSD